MNVTLITGATSGIGEALAHQLAERKHNLLLVARNEQKLKQLCNELADKNKVATYYIAANLSNPNAANDVFAESKKKNLFVNVLVNNAGIGSSGEFVKNNLQSELGLLQLNNASVVALCHLFLPEMISNKIGSIINVGSMAGFLPFPYMSVYAASKIFVRSFTQALTAECKPYGVNVMLFCPGLTTSNFMNTQANNNKWGEVITAGSTTQTPEQVATEMVRALEKQKTVHVSGRINAIATVITTGNLLPGSKKTTSF